MVKDFLILNGWVEGFRLKTSDLIILFTCAFCQSKVAEMIDEIAHIKSGMKPAAELIVGSCLPKTDKESLRRVFDGKTISPTDFSELDNLANINMSIRDMPSMFGKEAIGPQERHSALTVQHHSSFKKVVPKALNQFKTQGTCRTLKQIPHMLRSRVLSKRKAVMLSVGCLRKCSYCAIRFATGKLRSKPMEKIMQEFTEGLKSGCRKFELYADSIGDYGLDIGTNLGELFDELIHLRNKRFSIGIYDLHPSSFTKYFDKIMLLCKMGRLHYLYVPMQSGNERILRLMNRPCNVNNLKEKLLEIKRSKRVFLQTSIIVGFPTETEEDFEDTVRFLKEVDVDDAFIHFYTDMPKTKSSKLAGKVSKDTMSKRMRGISDAGIRHNVGRTKHEWENIPMYESILL
ncbi:MAG: radical SAM protein [Deltaproteobacteria bacterium]|nr:radical SAM protein [Deltaproteobacteria bacterium]MBW2170660.1 radical SAM protein [Deltaproteobacteria bacterium]